MSERSSQAPSTVDGVGSQLTVSCRPECFWRSLVEPPTHLRHLGPAAADIPGKRSPALELAGVEQRLVISCECQRITTPLERMLAEPLQVGEAQALAPLTPDTILPVLGARGCPPHFGLEAMGMNAGGRRWYVDDDVLAWDQLLRRQKANAAMRNVDENNVDSRCQRLVGGSNRSAAARPAPEKRAAFNWRRMRRLSGIWRSGHRRCSHDRNIALALDRVMHLRKVLLSPL